MAKLQITQQRKLWWLISGTLAVISVLAMAVSWVSLGAPLRLGLDFVGGTLIQVERDCLQANCDQPLSTGEIRSVLAEQGFGESGIQILGQEQQGMAIRTPSLDVDTRSQLQNRLAEAFGPFDPQRTLIDFVGPTIGKQLLIGGLLALLVAFGGITIYLTIRFQFDYAVLALLALFHDVLITSGVFSILGLGQGLEINTLFLVALLTIAGFSVNDTVVIYDRIRETRQYNRDLPIGVIIDNAVNQTLGRSINTTLTTLLPLVTIFLLGGTTLKSFALALIVGFVLGAYSSIFVASSLLGWWQERQALLSAQSLADLEDDSFSEEVETTEVS